MSIPDSLNLFIPEVLHSRTSIIPTTDLSIQNNLIPELAAEVGTNINRSTECNLPQFQSQPVASSNRTYDNYLDVGVNGSAYL